MHKFMLMFAVLATISMSSLAQAQPPGGQRGEGGQRGGAQRGEGGQRGGPRGEGGPRGGQRGQRPVSPMMTALDTDKDGKLSAEEISNAATALKTLDKNKDGILDADELAPPRGGRGGQGGNTDAFVSRIMERDADKDGKVSKEEGGERMERVFDRMDSDGDGFVTKAEIEKMAQQFQQRGGGGGRGGPQPSTKKERPAFDE